MKLVVSLLFFLLSVLLANNSIAQEEFYRNKGGMTFNYGHSSNNVTGHFNTVGAGIMLKNGIAFGISNQPILDEVKPQIYLGYLSKHKDEDFYARCGVVLNYLSSPKAKIIGGGFNCSYILNAQKQFPTSINGVFGINHFSVKNNDDYRVLDDSQMVPTAGLIFNQAFFNNYSCTPYVGVGLGYQLSDQITSYLVSFGLNINFNGRKEE